VKVVVGLGNPGPRFDDTRHNVGWWVVDRLAYDWRFGSFEKEGRSLRTRGSVGDASVLLIKPTTFMNRSGAALLDVDGIEECDFSSDLLLVVDDATMGVGRVRFRPEGGSGGHRGLRSVSGTLGTDSYARLRVGVGVMPEGADLSDWVLSPMSEADESTVVGLLPELSEAVGVWAREGIEEVMNQFNR
jgi:PTH1 family peptidyl-tRNA hydrolase